MQNVLILNHFIADSLMQKEDEKDKSEHSASVSTCELCFKAEMSFS